MKLRLLLSWMLLLNVSSFMLASDLAKKNVIKERYVCGCGHEAVSKDDLNQHILIHSLFAGTNPNYDLKFKLNGRIKNGDDLAQLLKKRNLSNFALVDRDLSNLNLVGYQMHNGSLIGVNLANSDLSGASMTNIDFLGAILIKTKFKEADLTGAQNLHKAIYKKCSKFPLSWLPWWEYDKEALDVQQIAQTLKTGYVVCQKDYTDKELDRLAKFKLIKKSDKT